MDAIDVGSSPFICVPLKTFARDPSQAGDPVQMAFVAPGADSSGANWLAASWLSGANVPTAICQVGPAGVATFAAGTYQIKVKITDSPEVLVLDAGQVTFE